MVMSSRSSVGAAGLWPGRSWRVLSWDGGAVKPLHPKTGARHPPIEPQSFVPDTLPRQRFSPTTRSGCSRGARTSHGALQAASVTARAGDALSRRPTRYERRTSIPPPTSGKISVASPTFGAHGTCYRDLSRRLTGKSRIEPIRSARASPAVAAVHLENNRLNNITGALRCRYDPTRPSTHRRNLRWKLRWKASPTP